MDHLETLDWTEAREGEEPEGKSLSDFLFPGPARRDLGSIVGWWERRRLHFNAIVGGTGLVTVGLLKLFTSLPPDPHTIPFFIGPVVAYALLANLCYTLGPVVEILLEKISRGKLLPSGPSLFRMGLTFSVGLTLFPVFFGVVDWIIRFLAWLF